MARQSRSVPRYDPSILAQYQPPEAVIAIPKPCFDLVGMDGSSPLGHMQPGIARLVNNLNIRFGRYQARNGVSVVGLKATSPLLYALDARLSDGGTSTIRFTEAGVETLIAGVWTAVAGDAFTGLQSAAFALCGWGDTVIFSGGIGGLNSLSFNPDTNAAIAGSPSGCIHLTVFGGRVIASLNTNRIQWSVKDDSTDWSGLGSGFEDLKSEPGGKNDTQTAVVPITDQIAYCIRSNSVWQVSLTGDFDAPLNFSMLMEGIGSRYPQTCVGIPQGVICVGDNGNVWLIGPSGVKDIGQPIRSYLLQPELVMQIACASYDSVYQEYRLSVQGVGILRYSIKYNSWTIDSFTFPVRSVSYGLTTASLTIDELAGTIDSLLGSISTLGVSSFAPGTMYCMGNDLEFVVRDDKERDDQAERDVDVDGTTVAGGFRLESGDLFAADRDDRRKDIIELVLCYEANQPCTVLFESSDDGGQTWIPMSSKVLPATVRPTFTAVRAYIDRKNVQIAISTLATPTVMLISLEAMTRDGARLVDAS